MAVHPVPGKLGRERPRRASGHEQEQVPQPALPAEPLLQLQRVAGNQAVARLLQRRRRVDPSATSGPRLQRYLIKKVFWKSGLEGEQIQKLDEILGATTKTENLTEQQSRGLIGLYEAANPAPGQLKD